MCSYRLSDRLLAPAVSTRLQITALVLTSFTVLLNQPILASHSKEKDGVLGKIIENLALGVKQAFSM